MASFARCTVRAVAFAAALVSASGAHAIEAPKPQAPPPEAPAPAGRSVTPSDQRAFYETMQRSAHTRTLRPLKVSSDIIDALARGAPDAAVTALSAAAATNEDANIALVRIQHWCNRVSSARLADAQTQISKLSPALSEERAAKAAGVIHAELEFMPRARTSCAQARFDFGAIEARLRAAAQAGKPASATELAQFVRDPKQREALLQAAIEKRYAPALYSAATNLVMAVQRGDTTENVSSIRLWLKQAGPSMPKAKLDLANCMALGCDGHPADAASARAFGLDAARDGEPTAFLSLARMPWGARLTRVEHLAWQHFGDRLNEAGCMGEAYIPSATMFAQTIGMLEKGQPPNIIEQAREQAEQLWRDNGARAMKEQGCGKE